MPLSTDPVSFKYIQQHLAAVRTSLANERTLLTYVRTSLTMGAFGLTLIQLQPVRAGKLGVLAVAAGIVIMVIGWWRYYRRRRQILSISIPDEST